MSLPSIASDPKTLCLQINESSPSGGLFAGDRANLHPESNLPWRISPEPFWLSPEQYRYLEQLGNTLHQFYKASNQLYHQSNREIAPSWVHEYLDRGKPSSVIEMGNWNRIKSQLPLIIRPDLLLTEHGFKLVELDSIPGGMGFTAQISECYADLGYDIVGGARGLIDPFYEAIAAAAKVPEPSFALFVSDESESYRREMEWLVERLQQAGKNARSAHPREVRFDENGLFLQDADHPEPWRIDVAYRFFELFDLKNIPKAELFTYFAKKNALRLTPPPKAYLEEKLWLALYHHPLLKDYWCRELGQEGCTTLTDLIPPRLKAPPPPCDHPRPPDRRKLPQRLANTQEIDQERARTGTQALGFFRYRLRKQGGLDRPRHARSRMGRARTRSARLLRATTLCAAKIPQSRSPYHPLLQLRSRRGRSNAGSGDAAPVLLSHRRQATALWYPGPGFSRRQENPPRHDRRCNHALCNSDRIIRLVIP